MSTRIVSKQALAIRRVLKKHLQSANLTDAGVRYSFQDIQSDIKSLAVTEENIRDAIDDKRLKREYVFFFTSRYPGERGRVLLISPKAKLFSQLSEFEIPSVCYCLKDRKTDTMFKMKGMPLIFTREMYAIGYYAPLQLDAVVKEISWEEISSQFKMIVLNYVDAEHELPVFNVTEFMIEYYMKMMGD